MDPHPLLENADLGAGFHNAALNNNILDVQNEDNWEQDDNWNVPQQDNLHAPLEDLLDSVQQEEMAWADGEELLPAFSNSSLSSDMSFSKGDNSKLFLPPVPAGNLIFTHNEPAALPPPAIVVANGLQNIIQAYQSDDEEPNLLHEQNVAVALAAEDIPVQDVANQLQQVDDSNPSGAAEVVVHDFVPESQVLGSHSPVLHMSPALETSIAPDFPQGDPVLGSEPCFTAQAGASSDQAIHCNSEHINTSRGGLESVTNIGDLQSGLQGNWVNQINEHFSMAPSLLGLKYIQLAATANNDHVVSEEGLLLWKKHFHEQSVENKKLLFCQHSCKLV